MQTFLSEPTFAESARVLDHKRLNKQLLEGRQMLNAIAGNQKGFANHPATNMWRGYEGAFYMYLHEIALEMKYRGIDYAKNLFTIQCLVSDLTGPMPPWWEPGREKNRIMLSHRANLYDKDPIHYAQYIGSAGFFVKTLAEDPLAVVCCATRRAGKPCGYYWPTHKEN